MGLWLKNEDGFVPVSGGGGSFDGEHVLTGDPDSPPEGWAVGQLLYDGLEDAAGDAGPHDHDYLPLEGGAVTGDLQVDGQVSFGVTSAGDWPLKLYDGSPTYFHGIGVGVNSLTFHVGQSLAAELGPGGWAFGIADDIDTQDVLDRAEVATMPVVDDDSVAATDADVDVLTVNEVVTAMLAKIKELSAEIKELKGA